MHPFPWTKLSNEPTSERSPVGHKAENENHLPNLVNRTQAADRAVTRAERDKLVLEHMPLVRAIAIQMHARLPATVDLDDLVQTGSLGLLAAARNFVSHSRAVFATYARHRITGAILDHLRELDGASRTIRRRQKQVRAATEDLSAELGRSPTESEIAQKLGMDVDRLRYLMLYMPVQMFSASTRKVQAGDGNELAYEFPDKLERRPDAVCAAREVHVLLESVIETLPERHRTAIRLYYTAEMTMKEVSLALGVNESRVSQLHKSALARMASILQRSGISPTACFNP